MKRISGTREWAVRNINCVTGCEHNCRYCFARLNALRRLGLIKQLEDWGYPEVRSKDVEKSRGKMRGRVMFPSTHDITPQILDPCLTVLVKLLKAGNEVLVVTKPHLNCVQAIVDACRDYRDTLIFRFTIGSDDDDILHYWEPGATTFEERLKCLQLAYSCEFQTSVSVEPMLDSAHIVRLFKLVEPFVTDTVWIGKMNKVRLRVPAETEEDEKQIRKIEEGQTDDRIKEIYDQLRDQPKIRWKESIKMVVGLPPATTAGQDL